MTKACLLSIRTGGKAGEELSDVTVSGRYEFSDRIHRVVFQTEGDLCHIDFNEEGLKYERSGEMSFTMDIREGNTSDLVIQTGYGEISTEYTVHGYKARILEDHISIETDYTSGDDRLYMTIDIKSDQGGKK